jgi:hypothetical protein
MDVKSQNMKEHNYWKTYIIIHINDLKSANMVSRNIYNVVSPFHASLY